MKVVVLGDTGMLGGMLRRYLEKQDDIDVSGFSRQDGVEVCPGHRVKDFVYDDADYIINCIGAIKPVFNDKSRLVEAIYTNAIFPHELPKMFLDSKIIHITTDCVFDGRDGGYTESSPHNPLDEYGKSKSLGEPADCMVLRTSIVGPEWGGNKRSLVEWFLSQHKSSVNGYTNHIWNGITTLELSRCIFDIIRNELYSNGTYHLFSVDINKYQLLRMMESWWKRGIAINPVEAPQSCNRTLRTTKELNSVLKPKSISMMLEELQPFIRKAVTGPFDEPLAVYPLNFGRKK